MKRTIGLWQLMGFAVTAFFTDISANVHLLRNHSNFVTQGVTQGYFTQTKSVVSVIQKHVTTLHIKLCASSKNKASGCGAAGSALPHTVETTSSSFDTRWKKGRAFTRNCRGCAKYFRICKRYTLPQSALMPVHVGRGSV